MAAQIPGFAADHANIDLGTVLNGFGFSIREACTPEEASGQCWVLSILYA